MKKKIIFIFYVLILINLTYGFNITNSNNELQNYFSLNNPNVFIKTNQNSSLINLSYSINSINYFKMLNLTSCSNLFCSNFSLLDFINLSNSSFSVGTKFKINLNNKSKNIYLDIEKPKFELLNYSINKEKKKLNLYYNLSDNFNISLIKLYKEQNSTLIFIKNISDIQNTSINISNSNNLSLVFEISDLAGNNLKVKKIILIEDIFKPKIINYKLILDEFNHYKFNFTIEDENLKKYEFIQNNLTMSEILSGKKLQKEVILPFNSGNIYFKIIDNNSNFNILNLNLVSTIIMKNKDIIYTNKSNTSYINNKIYKFESNADYCYLKKLDSQNLNEKFIKDNNIFKINLNLNLNKNYIIKFYCDKGNFRQFFKKNIVYDIIKPTNINFSLNKLNDGSIKINWSKSNDNSGIFRYQLIRNKNIVYSGKNLEFIDKSLVYPNSYSYKIKIYDFANNFVETQTKQIIPKKTKIYFETINLSSNQNTKNSNFEFFLKTDKNSTIYIYQNDNKNKLISNQVLHNNNSNYLKINLHLIKGINKLKIKVSDKFLNINEKFYNINLDLNPIIKNKNQNNNQNQILNDNLKNNLNNNLNNSNIKNNLQIGTNNLTANNSNQLKNSNKLRKSYNLKSWSFFLMVIFFILVIMVIYLFFYKNNDKLKVKINKKLNSIFKNKLSNKSENKTKKKDNYLDKSLEKVKLNRFEKQKINEKENLLKKRNKKINKGEFNKIKLKDLENKRINLKKENILNLKENKKFDKSIKPKFDNNLKRIKKINNKFDLNLFINEKINNFKNGKKTKTDEFSKYILNKKKENSWKNTSDYLMKTKIKNENVILEKNLKLENEKKLKENETKNNKIEKKLILKEKERLEKIKLNEDKLSAKSSFNEYLFKKTKKRKFFFAENEVNNDLKSRK